MKYNINIINNIVHVHIEQINCDLLDMDHKLQKLCESLDIDYILSGNSLDISIPNEIFLAYFTECLEQLIPSNDPISIVDRLVFDIEKIDKNALVNVDQGGISE